MKKIYALCQCFALLLFCGAWTYPQSGVNYPATGKAHNLVAAAACSPTKTDGCYGISTSAQSQNALMYVYGNGIGAELNPHFIVSYSSLLQQDCYYQSNQQACSFLSSQLNYLVNAGQSPRTGMTVWPLYQGRSDGLVQGGISILFNKQYGFDGNTQWLTLRDRAGRAFDWSWSHGGIAHVYNSSQYWYVGAGRNNTLYVLNVMTKALLNLHDLCSEIGGDWCTRRDRGWNVLNSVAKRNAGVDDFNCPTCAPAGTANIGDWSYHRIASETGWSNCGYHWLNADTLYRLIGRLQNQKDTTTIQFWANKWRASYDSSVAQGACPSRTWND